MKQDRFRDFRHRPSLEDIQVGLGPAYPLWERLTRFIDTHYQTSGELSTFGPKEVGWGLRYRWKGKSLVTLYPGNDRLTALKVLGKAQPSRRFVCPSGGI